MHLQTSALQLVGLFFDVLLTKMVAPPDSADVVRASDEPLPRRVMHPMNGVEGHKTGVLQRGLTVLTRATTLPKGHQALTHLAEKQAAVKVQAFHRGRISRMMSPPKSSTRDAAGDGGALPRSSSEEENDGRRSITLHLMDAGEIKLEIQWSNDPIHTASVCKIVGPPFIMTMLLGKAVAWGELFMPSLPVATSPGGGRAPREMLPPEADLHLDLGFKGKAPCVGMFAYSKEDITGEEYFLGRVSRVKNQKRTIQLGSSIRATNQMKLIFKEGGIAHGIELETVISPLSELLLPLEARRGVAPAKATLYGFLNPLSGLEGVLEEMHFGRNDPWAFLLLMGGYCYFDDAYTFLRANALVMSNTAPIHFTYTGPHPASDAGIAGMIAQERMADMTIDALQSEGCEQFGWIRGNELFDGQHSLDLNNPSSTASYPCTSPRQAHLPPPCCPRPP